MFLCWLGVGTLLFGLTLPIRPLACPYRSCILLNLGCAVLFSSLWRNSGLRQDDVYKRTIGVDFAVRIGANDVGRDMSLWGVRVVMGLLYVLIIFK